MHLHHKKFILLKTTNINYKLRVKIRNVELKKKHFNNI